MVKNIMFVEKGSLTGYDYNNLKDELKNTNVKVIEYEQCMTKPELVTIEDNTTAEENRVQIINEAMDKMLDALTRYIKDSTAQYVDFDAMQNESVHKIIYKGSRESFLANFVEFLNRG